MSNKSTWECKTSKYFSSPDFHIYVSSTVDESFNPQEILADIKEFEKYMIDKYIKKEEKRSWIERVKSKIFDDE